jgi:hypothetical protein
MIRVLAGSAIAALAVGLAGSFVAPSLYGVPRGEPMLVAGPTHALLQAAKLDEAACAARLLLAERSGEAIGTAPVRIVALAVQAGPRGLRLAIQKLPAETALPDGALALALAADGRIIAMWDAADYKSGVAAAALAADCDQTEPAAPVPGSV